MFKEFKEFALRGNMVDLAIGVIIGAAFSKVVTSLVNDVVMPPIGLILGGIDFSDLSVKLHIPGSTQAPVEVKYGSFINSLINLLIVSGVIFAVIKAMNRFYRLQPTNKVCPTCAMTIPGKAIKCGYCDHSFI